MLSVNVRWNCMVMNKYIKVEVAYATPTQQHVLCVEVKAESTIAEAIAQSGILTLFKEIDLTQTKVGVFSQPRVLSDQVKAGERIEIYRPLRIDPKDARRLKAKKTKKT
jgi:uncharacterized protein